MMFDWNGLNNLFLACLAIAAVLGWALIEGLIWLFHHVHIGWLP